LQKILIVDDEEGIRKVLGISLADSGYQVFTAENGEKALQLFRKEQPPIVLADIKMPGMDGVELLQAIKEENPDTEMIMVTGHGDIELAIRSLKYDATDFITKPIDDEFLEIALKKVNEKIALKKQLREYMENLERLVEEKSKQLVKAEHMAAVGQTVAGLAHAIKNVAGALAAGAFVLEKGIDLDNRKYLDQGWKMVRGNVRRIRKIALDLLNYAKEREPEYQFSDPNMPAREVFDLMKSRADGNNKILKLDLETNIPKVWFGPEDIHRVLMNLVGNAIDACVGINSKNKKGEVILQSCKTEGWAVEYQVADNGCGMDEETRNQIFQRFFSTKGSKGTGLGLMITKKIIDQHGGVIQMESKKGEGTKFIIRLPEREHDPGE